MKNQGYYVIAKPELGVFGPYSPVEINMAAVEAGHVEEDKETEAKEIERRAARFRERYRAAQVRTIQAGGSSLDVEKMESALEMLRTLDDRVAEAEQLERQRLDLELPVFIKPDVIVKFRWDRRGQVTAQLEAAEGREIVEPMKGDPPLRDQG